MCIRDSPFTKQCLQNVKVRHEFREGDPQANEFQAASIRHTNLLLRAAQLGLNVSPFETHVKEQPQKRYLTSLEMLAKKKKEELAKVGLKAGAIARELGFTAMTKADLDILLKNKGMKPGADKKTSYDMYITSL